ncbi:hypothetical protein [uncultured Dokdonia sp.]|uniref:hypothetical protein n=1 Tax=uncultured Dokdonia sp. TaxID=575653 RepID=UPI002635F25C|nr:hypothetical protein [uncultured Dokdonia sp.]
MSLTIFRLLLDFGLVVLIWIIQLIVYPSFHYYDRNSLVEWHSNYTSRFSFIVIPLMLGQLGIAFYSLTLTINFNTIINLVIIVIIWLITFLIFVPIHSKISRGKISDRMLSSLVRKNWLRTIFWNTLFAYNFAQLSNI